MTTLEFCQKLFQGYDLRDPRIQKSVNEFFAIIIATLVDVAKDRLMKEDEQHIEDAMTRAQYQDILGIVESKYTSDEWNELLDTRVMPLFDSYRKEVLTAI